MNILNACITRIVIFYHKFQNLILTLFVIGLFDLVVYGDAMISLFAFPEFAPLVVMILLGLGLYKRWRKQRKKTE
ncbi:hypothetical protein ACQCN2_02715 [Brevibacillus ginsengisoli]|uniref:hypothetical protein n=1 Tax=Brevibacillus ginsengisoli TaxID=363854 RepID=UPI003CEF1596